MPGSNATRDHDVPTVSLRPALPSDLLRLLRWDEQPHVHFADPDDEVWDWAYELSRTPDWREQLIGEVNGRPVGMVQIIDPAREDTHYWGDASPSLRAIDIWIGEASDLGRGYGTTMMRLALGRCFAPPEVEAVLLDPLATNTRAHRFYERLGFHFVECRDFDGTACFVYRLDRSDWAAGLVSDA